MLYLVPPEKNIISHILPNSNMVASEYYSGTRGYLRVTTILRQKQDGLCNPCEKPILPVETIVRRGQRWMKYYHRQCAEKLHFL